MFKCISCSCETNKYKCPTCSCYYCSLPCFKTHKETPCEPVTSDVKSEDDLEKPWLRMPFKSEDTVDIEKLKDLENSEGLKNLLYNPHLREFLKEVDRAPNAWRAIRAAMQEPLFIEFADECMKVVEPQNESDFD